MSNQRTSSEVQAAIAAVNEKFMAAHMLSEQAANFSKVYSTFCD